MMAKATLTIAAGAALMMLSGCGEDKPAPAPAEDAATMTPGEYEITSEVTKLQSTDKSTPATSAKLTAATEIKTARLRRTSF